MVAGGGEALERAAARVRRLARHYRPPDFAHVPDPDAAIFLCAIDHRTGYRHAHEVDGNGPFAGSELMWAAGLRSAKRAPGRLTAARLCDVTAVDVARWFRVDDETVAKPEVRAALWRDLATGLERDHGGSAAQLLAAADGRLAGPTGLIALLRPYQAYADPVAKKAFLFAKIAERRGWLTVADPQSWEVSSDNVLMRLALRSGLVPEGPLERVRPATREALRELAAAADLSPPVLDDLLWELGRDDPDLLGNEAGEVREPARDPRSTWY